MCDEKLIRAVEKRRTLYDVTHVLYKNNCYRKKIWNDIAIEIEMPVDVCQKKWKRLRERYSELNKKEKSGSAAKARIYKSLLVSMGFLKPYLRDNPKFLANSLVEHNTTNPTIKLSMDNASSTSLRSLFAETDPKTRIPISELIAVLKEPTPEYDSVDYYCMSLAADMKKMEPNEQRRIRLEITKIMSTAVYKD